MKYLFIGFLILILQGLPLRIIAQFLEFETNGLPPFQVYSPKEYEASRQSWSILQDDRGIMFFGNNEGLLTFDGSNWELIPSPNGALIRSLAMDEHGVIYYGGKNDLGYVSSDSLGQLTLVSLKDKLPSVNGDINDVWEIRYLHGEVIFQTYRHLFLVNIRKEEDWADRSFRVISPPEQIMSCAVIDSNCYVHVKGEGLNYILDDQLQPVSKKAFTNELMVDMLPWFPHSNKANMLLCELRNGLFSWDGDQLLPFPLDKQAEELIQAAKITNATYLSDGTLALATDNLGLIVLNADGRLVNHLHKGSGFPVDDTNDLLVDKQGGLWVTTSLGIIRVDLPARLMHFSDQSNLNHRVYSMTLHKKQLYVGTTNGLFVSPISGEQRFQQVEGPNTAVFGLLSTEKDLLVASPYSGVYQLDDNKLVKLLGQVPVKLTHSRFNEKIVYVGDGSDEFGFSVLYKTANRWHRILTSPLIREQIRYVEEESPGVLWLGSRSKGFLRVEIPYLKELNTESSSELFQLDSLVIDVRRYPDSLTTMGFRARPYYVHNKIYLASSEGLKQLNVSTNQLVPDPTLGPVLADTSTHINHLVAGPKQSIWANYAKAGAKTVSIGKLFPTDNGQYSLEEQTDLLRMSDLQFTTMLSRGEANDPLWLGTTNGLLKFQPQIMRNNRAAFSTLVRQVYIHGDSLLYAGNSIRSGAGFTSPILAYSHNALRFKFSAVNYEVPENTMYQYQLQGFDDDWSGWTSENQKDYTNLPEGVYEFRVRSTNIYGAMGSEGTFSFEILPPWYRKWWAYLLYVVFGMAFIMVLILSYNKWKTRQLELKNKELQQAVEEKTQEILETQKQLVLQEKMASLGQMTAGMAHEMKNPLNFINNFSQGSIELLDDIQLEMEESSGHEDREELKGSLSLLKKNIESIYKNGVRMDKIVLGMLNHTSISAGERVSVNMNKLIDESADLAFFGFKGLYPQFDFQIVRDYERDQLMARVYPNELSKSLLNIFDNACFAIHKKAQALDEAYSPTIKVSLQTQGNHLSIRIWDNGNGIAQKDRENIFTPFYTTKPTGAGNIGLGLSIAYDLIVKRHQGRFSVESEPGSYTAFIIELLIDERKGGAKEMLSPEGSLEEKEAN